MSEIIEIDGLQFEPFIDATAVIADVDTIAQRMKTELNDLSRLYAIVVLQGAVPFGMDLMRRLPKSLEMDFIAVKSYSGLESNGAVKLMMDIKGNIKGRDVLIIEDIVDKGHTLDFLMRHLRGKSPKSIQVATYLFKPEAYCYKYRPEFIGRSVPNEFVLGYGMDYNGQGRLLPDIYRKR